MIDLFKGRTKPKELRFERVYAASVNDVWAAWTDAEAIKKWWGPKKTHVPECTVDLRVGGEIRIVTEATEAMGKYAGTRWPMEGTFREIQNEARMTYDAKSWSEPDEATTTILHVNDVTFEAKEGSTLLKVHITINEVGSGAKMAVMGMKMGWKAYLDKFEQFLASGQVDGQ